MVGCMEMAANWETAPKPGATKGMKGYIGLLAWFASWLNGRPDRPLVSSPQRAGVFFLPGCKMHPPVHKPDNRL